jgi:photosystem II stability/assembly factor-like uncharacterized protein
MLKLLRTWGSALAIAIFASPVHACTVVLSGPEILALYIHPKKPEVVFARTNRGFYESRNRGESWVQLSEGLGPEAWAFAFDLQDPNKFYIAGRNKGYAYLYTSSDGGESFRSITRGLADARNEIPPIGLLAVDPNNTRRILAASEDGLIFVSDDAGETWHPAYSGERVWSLAFDPSTPNTVYAGLENNLIVSRDGGVTWTEHLVNLQTQYGPSPFEALAVSRSGKEAYAVVAGDLFRSDDSAKTFHRISNCSKFAVAPSDPRIIFAGCGAADMCFGSTSLSKSLDGGKSWKKMLSPSAVGRTLAVDPSDPDVVYVGNPGGGLYRTLNGGKSWAWADEGMAIDPSWRKLRQGLGMQ